MIGIEGDMLDQSHSQMDNLGLREIQRGYLNTPGLHVLVRKSFTIDYVIFGGGWTALQMVALSHVAPLGVRIAAEDGASLRLQDGLKRKNHHWNHGFSYCVP